MGSMMSSFSVFSGAGTILGPLISMAGPGIMVTVMSMIASYVMSTVLTPLFSQFTSTVLSNDLDTLMAPLGGTSTGALALLDGIAGLTSVTSQPGVTSQNSGSGYIAQSTGTSVGTTGTSNTLSSLGSSGTCDITAIGTCLANEFNTTLLLGQTALDNSNGPFSSFFSVVGLLVTAIETLTGSSSTSVTSAVAPAKVASTTVATSTTTSATTSTIKAISFTLGVLATIKDLLGLAKTYLNGTSTLRKISRTVIQWIRLSLEFTQLFLSVQLNELDPSNMVSSMWLFKSIISTSTSSLSFLNNFNDLVPLNILSTFSITNGWASTYSFEQVTLFLQGVVQGFGALGALFIYLLDESSIPSGKVIVETLFVALYIGQRAAKAALFILKIFNDLPQKWEKILYVISAALNLFQMATTILTQ